MSAPRRRLDLTFEEIVETGELIVVDPEDDKASVLNPTAAAVWLLCDGQRAVAEIAEEIVATLGERTPGMDQVRGDVDRCVEMLVRERLLEASEQPS